MSARTDSQPPGSGQPPPEGHAGRLDSWKEVAAYVRRDVKTVQRWERHEGLPVHRLHHTKLGSVYAYRHEIDGWVAMRGLTANGDQAEGGGTGSSQWRAIAHGLAAVAALTAVAGVIWTPLRPPPEGSTGTRAVFQVDPPPGAVFAGTVVDPEPTISPDGSLLVFRAAERDTGRQRLYVRRLDASATKPLAGTEQAIHPFFSPDSHHVGFFGGGELRRVDLASGVVTALARAPHPGGGAWLASGDIVFNPDADTGIHVLKRGAGPALPVTTVDRTTRQTRHLFPVGTPDGRRFLYFAEHENVRSNAIWLWRGPADADRRVTHAERMGRIAPGGWLLAFRGRHLVAHRLDETSSTVVGAPVSLRDAIDGDDPNGRSPAFSLSATGVLAYWPVGEAPMSRLTWFDRQGHETGVVGPSGRYPFVAISPDGRSVAVQRVDEENGAPDLWVHDLSTGTATRLTASPVNEEDPVWSPSGREIAFAKHTAIGADAQLRRILPSHPLSEGHAGRRPVAGHPTDWSHDGRLLVFQVSRAETLSDLFGLPVPDGTPIALAGSPFNERHGRLSPDGRHLAYSSDVSGRLEVYVTRVPANGAVRQVSNAGGAHPRWRRDGRELFYLAPSGLLMTVGTSMTPEFSAGRPMPLFDARPPLPLAFLDTLYDVTADGERFLVAASDRPATTSFTVVVNALAGLPQ